MCKHVIEFRSVPSPAASISFSVVLAGLLNSRTTYKQTSTQRNSCPDILCRDGVQIQQPTDGKHIGAKYHRVKKNYSIKTNSVPLATRAS